MTEFQNIMESGLAETMQVTPKQFQFRGKTFSGVFSPGGESASLDGGGFDSEISASLCIPFTQIIGPKPKHDEVVIVDGVRHAVATCTVNEASWDVDLVATS